jgi:ribosomal protein L30
MSARKTAKAKKMIKITQVRSEIGNQAKVRKVLHGLGLGRVGRTVTRPDDPCIRGMVNKVTHLVTVEEAEG